MAAPPARALGSRDPESQTEWLRLLADEPWVQLLQARTRRRLELLCRELACRADWDSFECFPTWERLMTATGWARSTMSGWLRQLRICGWLTVIEHGSTPQYRPMGVMSQEGNRAAVYALRVPEDAAGADQVPDILQQLAEVQAAAQRRIALRRAARLGPYITTLPTDTVDKNWTPTLSPHGESVTNQSGSFARESRVHKSDPKDSVSTEIIEALRARIDDEGGRRFPLDAVPRRRAEMLAAAAEIRREEPVAARLSVKHVRAIARPHWRAGWSSRDVLHALRWRPSSWSDLPAMPAEAVIVPHRWLAARLDAWRDEHGQVLPSRSQHQRTVHTLLATHGDAGIETALATLGVPGHQSARLADLLGPDLPEHLLEEALTPEAVRTRGHRAHQHLQAEQRLAARAQRRDQRERPTPRTAAASADTRSAVRAQLDHERSDRERRRTELREHLLDQARQHTQQTDNADQQYRPNPVGDDVEPAHTPEQRHARARRRARRDGHAPHQRRRYRR